jgi:hypothetical protein
MLTLQHANTPTKVLARVWAVFLVYAAAFLFSQYAFQFDEVRHQTALSTLPITQQQKQKRQYCPTLTVLRSVKSVCISF